MKRLKKRICASVITAILLLPLTVSAASYNYNYERIAVESPDVATVEREIEGIGFSDPSDFAMDSKGRVYVADTGNNRIVVLDENNAFSYEIRAVDSQELNAPAGVFVDANDRLYICDSANGRVIVCNLQGELIRYITASGEEVFDTEFSFSPQRVCADAQGNTFVISSGVYDGLMQFDRDGGFVGYVGANEVNVSLWDRLWKSISTQTQRDKSRKDVPTEFDSLDMDSEGFVYTVTSTVSSTNPASDDPVRKQTALGINIIKSSTITGKPVGDILFPYWNQDASIEGASAFVDVSVTEYGYLCLDSKRGRIFAYNENGDVMFILGGYGAKRGCFTKPVAVESFEDRIFVLDRSTNSITVFRLAEYGADIIHAQQQYLDGDYDASRLSWQRVLNLNSNSSLAYVGLGKVYLMQGEYRQAMKYLRLGGDKEFYSKAFGYQTQEIIADHMLAILLGAAAFVTLFVVWLKRRRKSPALFGKADQYEWVRGLRYGFYIMLHPFDGYWDMTHEKKGCMRSGIIWYGIYVFSWIFEGQFTGFLYRSQTEFNLLKTLGIAVLPIVLWCLCNWSVSTLLDGEGKPSAIVLSTAYALIPYCIAKWVCLLLSNLLTLDQSMFITLLTAFALAWTAFLLFSSVVTIHGYSAKQAIGTILLILFAMAIVLFLAVLVINLVQQMAYFIISIYDQLILGL